MLICQKTPINVGCSCITERLLWSAGRVLLACIPASRLVCPPFTCYGGFPAFRTIQANGQIRSIIQHNPHRLVIEDWNGVCFQLPLRKKKNKCNI